MEIKEVISVILISIFSSVLGGVVLFGIFGVSPGLSWTLIAVAASVLFLITVSSTLAFYLVFRRYGAERTIKVAMMTLSDDEQVVLRKIMEMGGELRQDDLWRKLRENYSKSKLSALVINLEKKHALTRARYHRTNLLKLTKEFAKH